MQLTNSMVIADPVLKRTKWTMACYKRIKARRYMTRRVYCAWIHTGFFVVHEYWFILSHAGSPPRIPETPKWVIPVSPRHKSIQNLRAIITRLRHLRYRGLCVKLSEPVTGFNDQRRLLCAPSWSQPLGSRPNAKVYVCDNRLCFTTKESRGIEAYPEIGVPTAQCRH